MNKNKRIIVQDYNASWAIEFTKLKNAIVKYIGKDIISIEHVGSTSIVGLKAKPIIDMDIIIKDDESKMKTVITALSKLGYHHIGDLGVTGREAFKKENKNTPIDGSNTIWHEHHLYLCKEGSIGLTNHLNFRDYLREHYDKVVEYGQLKSKLADKFPYDIDAYIDGKTNFIVDILKKSGMDKYDTDTIDDENRLV